MSRAGVCLLALVLVGFAEPLSVQRYNRGLLPPCNRLYEDSAEIDSVDELED